MPAAAPANLSEPHETTRAPTIYPAYCHDASLTLPQWCPLRAVDVHALRDVGMFVPGRFATAFSAYGRRVVELLLRLEKQDEKLIQRM